jgi:hypothetical protein
MAKDNTGMSPKAARKLAERTEHRLGLDAPAQSSATVADDRPAACRDIERAVNALQVIKHFAVDAIMEDDNDRYLTAIKDLAHFHGKRLDDTLARLQGGPATGIFDADDD